MLVEDLHWADTATLDLLEHLLTRGLPVPVVGTWREEDPATPTANLDWLTRVRRLGATTTLALEPLTREETAEQLQLMNTGAVGELDVDRIYERSRGQPLFTEQLAAADALDDGDQPLPQRLGDLLDRRLDGLDSSAETVARALGVADRSLTDQLLHEITGLSAVELSNGLRDLDRRRLLRRSGGGAVELRHPLLAEAVRGRLLGGETTDEHRRLAAALTASDNPSPAEVAEHWQRADEPEQELSWRIRAARAADARFALAQAAAQWQRALALWPDDVTSAGNPPTRKVDAYLAAMDALRLFDSTTAWAVAEAAMRTLTDLTEAEAASVHRRAGSLRTLLGDPARALLLLEQAISVLENLPRSREYVLALESLQHVQSGLGRDQEGAATAALAAEISSGLGDPLLHRTCLACLALYDASAGDLDQALARVEAARAIDVDVPDPREDVELAIIHTVILLDACVDPEEVADAARPGLESAATWGLDTRAVGVLHANVAMAMRRAGRVSRSAEIVDALTAEEPSRVRQGPHIERAAVDIVRGRLGEATKRFEAMVALPLDSLYNLIEFTGEIALADLWCGRPRAALDRLLDVLNQSVTTDASVFIGMLLDLSARAAADLAGASGLNSDARPTLLATLEDLRASATHEPFAPQPAFAARPAHGAAWAAETARLAGRPSLELWTGAATAWDRISRPHDSAYCRWRGAQVALAASQGTIAARLLKRAARDAREHVPLLAAIEETAAYARARERRA